MPDLIQTVMAIKASVQPELGQIIYMPDLTSHIQFGSVLPKKAWIILCKTSLAPIWMAWSGFGQKHLVRKQAGVHESLSLVLAERNQPATSFPPLASVAFRWPGSYWAKPAWILFGSVWLCQVFSFWPNESGPEASQYASITGPASGQHFQADLDGM